METKADISQGVVASDTVGRAARCERTLLERVRERASSATCGMLVGLSMEVWSSRRA